MNPRKNPIPTPIRRTDVEMRKTRSDTQGWFKNQLTIAAKPSGSHVISRPSYYLNHLGCKIFLNYPLNGGFILVFYMYI